MGGGQHWKTIVKDKSSAHAQADEDGISAVAASVILAVLTQVYAGVTLRGLYADGAFMAAKFAAHQLPVYTYGNPARLMSAMIVSWPVMAAMHLGVQTPYGVALVFSLVVNLLPGLIILLCLPAMSIGERHFFIFPAFVYFAGTLSAQFASSTEGLIATSYFWLLLCLITFGHFTVVRSAIVAVLAIGSLKLHEHMLFLGPILVVAGTIRWWHEPRFLPRNVLAVTAVCAVASAVIAANFAILHPYDVHERDEFIRDFLAGNWLYARGALNVPIVLGTLAAPCILLILLRPAFGTAVTWIFAAVSITLALAPFEFDRLINPITQWAARHNAALMSLPLAALLLYVRAHTPLATAMLGKPTRRIVVLLGLTVSLWHVAATEQWSAFLTHFSNVLQSQNGIIAFDTLIAPPGSRQAKLAAKMVWPWTNPDLSIVALPRSCINSVIANPTSGPHNLSDLATVPAIPGVTYTYLLPLDQQRAACSTK
jgi:hypothetical protein